MKIKYIVNVRLPTIRAQGYAIMKMCECFANAGIDVELVIPERRYSEIKANPFEYYQIKEKFKIKRIKSVDLLGSFFVFGWLFYWTDIVSFLLSAKLSVGLHDGDVLYTRDYLVPLFFSKKDFMVLELHDIPTSKFLFKQALKKPKLFFVLNQNLKDEIISMGVNPDLVHIAPSGVDIKDFDISESQVEARIKVGLPTHSKIVLYSGQFYDWKGVDVLAEAAKLLPQHNFVFVGGVEPELSAFKAKYGSLNNVTILPSVNRSLVPHYLKAADVLVVPNSAKGRISTHFTSPLKLYEYMATKKPVVISDMPSMRQAVGSGSVMFCGPDNPEALAKAIENVLNDENLSRNLVDKAYMEVQEYSWEERAKKIISLMMTYKQV